MRRFDISPRRATPKGHESFISCTAPHQVALPTSSSSPCSWHTDAKYTGSFDAIFAADGIETVPTAPRAPRMNAHCERVIGTLRREVLDHLLIRNENHARQVLDAYARHYNHRRPHQARRQLPPLAGEHPAPLTDLTTHRLLRTRVLGGVVNEYRYAS